MPETLRPSTAAELADAIAGAAARGDTLDVIGRGSKSGYGRPTQSSHRLELAGLNGIIAYEPEELVLTARAGTLLAEIEHAVEAKRQMLAFEPPDLGPLYGLAPAGGSLGGAIACNLAGPRRIKSGAARDHVLGFAGVNGRGEPFKAGGKVVKNVTGYDLSKLFAGSFGTLAVASEITLKVMPRPEKTRTVIVLGLDPDQAVVAMADALNSPHEVSGAAHLPAAVAARSTVDRVRMGASVTALRLEGMAVSVEARCASLRASLADRGPGEELHSMSSTALWRELRDGALLGAPGSVIWRVSAPPTRAPELARIASSLGGSSYCDWGGGLTWIACDPGSVLRDDAGATAIRAAIAACGGAATMLRAPAALRLAVPVFEPLAAPLDDLTRRVKDGFDPRRVLNPGRLYQGM